MAPAQRLSKRWRSHCFYTAPFLVLSLAVAVKQINIFCFVSNGSTPWPVIVTLVAATLLMDVFWGYFPTIGQYWWYLHNWTGESLDAAVQLDKFLEARGRAPRTLYERLKTRYTPAQYNFMCTNLGLCIMWAITIAKAVTKLCYPLHPYYLPANMMLDGTWWILECWGAIYWWRTKWAEESRTALNHRDMYSTNQILCMWAFTYTLSMLAIVIPLYHFENIFRPPGDAVLLMGLLEDIFFVILPIAHMFTWWNRNYMDEETAQRLERSLAQMHSKPPQR